MKALLVIDVQNAIVDFSDFKEELVLIEQVIKDFKARNYPVIFVKHEEEAIESPFYKDSGGAKLHKSIKEYAEVVICKQTPSAFFNTKLMEVLQDLKVEHVFITGFNTEFCCMFTAIAAYDRGFKVTFLENVTGTVNTGKTYEMEDLDIRDFVGTVLDWSGAIEVLEFEEYLELYAGKE